MSHEKQGSSITMEEELIQDGNESDKSDPKARRGGAGNFANDPERAAAAGRKGGQSQGRETNPGNFANDREKAREAGRKGGRA